MRFRFTTEQLSTLYTSGVDIYRFGNRARDAFFEAMAIIAAASGEPDLCAFTFLRVTPLTGNRADHVALHLHAEWHLIVRFATDEKGLYLAIVDLTNGLCADQGEKP